MKDFLFGKLKTYVILSEGTEYTVVGRGYSHRRGMLIVRDCFTRVATFVTFKNIIEK